MSDEVRVTSDECETVAGIEAELRKTADDMAKTLGDQHTYVEFYRKLADRIEKARAPLGNAAKMREALKRLLTWLDKYGHSYSTPARFTEDEIKAVWAERQEIVQQCRAALAAPARNCDLPLVSEVPTSNPADAAWRAFRECHPGTYLDVPGLLLCINWLLAPAEGGAR